MQILALLFHNNTLRGRRSIKRVKAFDDDLMDSSSIVGQDVELGMTLTADPVFASKESPSHESDSGCSDMYEDRSVSPNEIDILSSSGTVDQVDLFDFESITNEDDIDNELAGYLSVAKPPQELAEQTVEPVMDSDYSDSDPDYQPVSSVRKIVQAKAIRSKPVLVSRQSVNIQPVLANKVMPDICVLPSSSRHNSSFTIDGCAPKPTAVKVVKVIKTNATTKQDVDNELMKALDDRNKKNAVQAKVNREKKKAYIQSLEEEIHDLKSENATLRMANEKDKADKKELIEEVEYLKSVLANHSALAGLLKNIGNVEHVNLSSSISRKRSASHDHDYLHAPKKSKSGKSGVCLHVDQGNVSLEFCSKCASMSKLSGDENS